MKPMDLSIKDINKMKKNVERFLFYIQICKKKILVRRKIIESKNGKLKKKWLIEIVGSCISFTFRRPCLLIPSLFIILVKKNTKLNFEFITILAGTNKRC